MSNGLQLAQVRAENMQRYGYGRISENRCPRRLVGKRHLELECWCVTWLKDHAGTYRHEGQKVVLWEPYDAGGSELAEVIAAAAADGLRVIVHGQSPYNPGRTVAIEFRRADR